MPKPFVWVALDGLSKTRSETLEIARRLHSEVEGDFGFKVNLDFILRSGIHPAMLSMRALSNRRVFVDLKTWNGHRTMSEIFHMMLEEGVSVTNAYALAGGYDSKQQGQELRRAIEMFRGDSASSGLKIYAVTVLTHYGDAYCERMFGRPLIPTVCALVKEGTNAGADGVIMPGTLLEKLPGLQGISKICPGYRDPEFTDDRHEESYGPDDVQGVSNLEIVCGSPIMKAEDPVAAFRRILAKLPES